MMGQIEILRKLNEQLERGIQDECQVVYVLSMIRKYLESKNQKNHYKYLYFYCNWALHSKIEKTEVIAEILRGLEKGEDYSFVFFFHFFEDFKRFALGHNFPQKVISDRDNLSRLRNILIDIYSDTPLEFYLEEKRALVIKKERIDAGGRIIPFSIQISQKGEVINTVTLDTKEPLDPKEGDVWIS